MGRVYGITMLVIGGACLWGAVQLWHAKKGAAELFPGRSAANILAASVRAGWHEFLILLRCSLVGSRHRRRHALSRFSGSPSSTPRLRDRLAVAGPGTGHGDLVPCWWTSSLGADGLRTSALTFLTAVLIAVLVAYPAHWPPRPRPLAHYDQRHPPGLTMNLQPGARPGRPVALLDARQRAHRAVQGTEIAENRSAAPGARGTGRRPRRRSGGWPAAAAGATGLPGRGSRRRPRGGRMCAARAKGARPRGHGRRTARCGGWPPRPPQGRTSARGARRGPPPRRSRSAGGRRERTDSGQQVPAAASPWGLRRLRR